MKRRILLIALVVVIAAGVAAAILWDRRATPPVAQAAPAPPPAVGTSTLSAADVPLTFNYAGRVASFRSVEIRAQVGGTLLKREFQEGDKVQKGQALFKIDPVPYEVALSRANATRSQAQASQRQAQENFSRAAELARRGAGTEKALQDAQAALDQAQAAVQLADSDVRTAQLNLGYTTISAPVTGLTGLETPPEGSLALAQQTVLTTITQIDPAYVNYSITDSEYQQFRAMEQARGKPFDPSSLKVKLQLGDGTVYEPVGKFEVSSNAINPQTGTLQLRAIFPNPSGAILPGQLVRVIITGIDLPNAIVVPKEAVSQGPQGPFVYRLDDKDVASAQPIRLGRDIGDRWVVDQGLSAGDRIVVDGLIRVKPGAAVRPSAPAKAEQKQDAAR